MAQESPEPIGVAAAMILLQGLHADRFADSAEFLGTVAIDDTGMQCEGQGFSGDGIALFAHVAEVDLETAKSEMEAVISKLPNGLRDLEPPPKLLLDPAAPFPVDALPSPAREIVTEQAHLRGLPLEVPALMVLGTISASLGKGLTMPSLPGLSVSGNLYTAAAMPTGAGKSVIAAPIFKPLHDFQADQLQHHAATVSEAEARLRRICAKLDRALLDEEKATEPSDAVKQLCAEKAALEVAIRAPRFLIEDATVEAMAIRLSENGEYLASVSADAKSAFANLGGRYRKGGKEDDLYIKAFSGDSLSQDRVGRGYLYLRNPRLTIVWMTQHGSFDAAFSSEGLADSGFLPRFIAIRLARPPRTENWDAMLSPATQANYEARVHSLLTAYLRRTGSAHKVPVAPEAAAVMRQFKASVNAYITGWRFPKDLQGYPDRWAENAYRLKLVLHAAQHGGESHLHPVTEETARNAVRLMTWFAAHQEELLARYVLVADKAKFAVALKFVNQSPTGVTARDLARHSSAHFPNNDEARRILDDLESEGRVTSHRGHKTMIFQRLRKSDPKA